jgi:membrane peptidoglycan carboxypeptidase
MNTRESPPSRGPQAAGQTAPGASDTGTLLPEELAGTQKRSLLQRLRHLDKRWLIFLPALAVIVTAFLYARVAVTMASPADVMAGLKGLEIYDRNGQLIHSFDEEQSAGRVVPLAEISPHLINATIATEDAEYWDHPGVNFKGLARAAYENVAFWETGGFFQGSGGSSITQQLAKNIYIKPEDRPKRSPLRKFNETIIAFELNRRYSKEQILEWYLANLYYGNGAYGIEAASYRYFNKAPAELTLAESALLAGLPRSPNFYEPIGNQEAAVERQQQVLDLMARHDFIADEEAFATKQQPLALNEGSTPGTAQAAGKAIAPHFAQYVRDLLPALLGQENVAGDLKVTTSLDLALQTEAERIVRDNLQRVDGQNGTLNGALVTMDPKTGEVLAMVGSRDFNRNEISGQVNNATAVNQSGSAIKPVTYLAAFQKNSPQYPNGWTADTVVKDERILLGDEQRPLGNANNRYNGDVPVRRALGSSLNPPAVLALRYAGLDSVMALSRSMGITTLRDISQYGDAYTLGADVSLLDLTYVYSVLANQGQQAGMNSVLGLPAGSRPQDPISVLKVETREGDVVWQPRKDTKRVVAADEVFQITEILADNQARLLGFQANNPMNLPGRTAAAKTGASDDTRDAWTLGYTPIGYASPLVVGVWVGHANNAPIPNGTSTFLAAPIWRDFMLKALEGQPDVAFQKPGGGTTPTATPTQDKKEDTPTPQPSETPEPTQTPQPTQPAPTPRATNTPQPTNTPVLPTFTPVQTCGIVPIFPCTPTPTPRGPPN